LMAVGLFAFTTGGSLVVSMLTSGSDEGSRGHMLSSTTTSHAKVRFDGDLAVPEAGVGLQKDDMSTPRPASVEDEGSRRDHVDHDLEQMEKEGRVREQRDGAKKAVGLGDDGHDGAGSEEEEEDEGGEEEWEEGAEDRWEEEDEDGWGEEEEEAEADGREEGEEVEEDSEGQSDVEKEEDKPRLGVLNDRLHPFRRPQAPLDFKSREAVEMMVRERQEGGGARVHEKGGVRLAARAQAAADRIREKREEMDAPVEHPGPRDPSLPTHASLSLAEAQEKLQALSRSVEEQAALNVARRGAVKAAILHAWEGYKEFAWGMDELAPVAKKGLKWFGLGLTLVDSLDLLWLVGEKDEFWGARDWVAADLDVSPQVHVNVFEVTIRVLGGLLSAFHFSQDPVFLEKAQILGRNLRSAMESPSGVPWSDAVLGEARAFAPPTAPDSSVSEATSIQLEFKYLAHVSKDESLYRLAEHSMRAVDRARAKLPSHGHRRALPPMFINARTGDFNRGSTITLGARGDSYYEYLLKQWLLTGKREDFYRDRYLEAVAGIKAELFRHSEPEGRAFIAELASGSNFSPKMDHLVCYLPGTLALGVHHGIDPTGEGGHMEMARELMVTCFEFYNQTATGLSPEIAHFRVNPSASSSSGSDLYVKPRDTHNMLRPETVESLFYLYRVTGDAVYQEWAWQIFQAFEAHAKIPTGGYSGLENVGDPSSPRIDKMESFFLGETLKYLFLLFEDPSLFSLDEYVLNTEAHPFPIMSPEEDWLVYKGKGGEKDQEGSAQERHADVSGVHRGHEEQEDGGEEEKEGEEDAKRGEEDEEEEEEGEEEEEEEEEKEEELGEQKGAVTAES